MTPQANIDSLSQFLDKFQTAKNYNSKEMRLTIQEAEQLSLGIARVLARQAVLADKVIALQDQIMNGVEVAQDGGSF